MNENTPRICPVCGQTYTEYPAISRRDNKTHICPECGVREALEDLAAYRRRAAGMEKRNA